MHNPFFSYTLPVVHAMGTLCKIANDCIEVTVPMSRHCVNCLMLQHSARGLERSFAHAASWGVSVACCMTTLYCCSCEAKDTTFAIMHCSWSVPAHHLTPWPSDCAAESDGSATINGRYLIVPWLQVACGESSRI